ncbi:Ser/Thr protein kinase [Cryptosporidium canis]|nr:Ser/Thr protein kinase [Cryptosporidium canis]
MLVLCSNGDICIETDLSSGERWPGMKGALAFCRRPDEVGLVHFRERDQSKFVGRVRKSDSRGRGIVVAVDGSIYASEYAAGEFSRGCFLGRCAAPLVDESFIWPNALGSAGRDLSPVAAPAASSQLGCWDSDLEFEAFRSVRTGGGESAEALLRDLLRSWGLEEYLEVLQMRLSLQDLLVSSSLLSMDGIRETLGISKVGHRIKLANCIKQFRLVFGSCFLPKRCIQRPSGSELSSSSLDLRMFVSRPLNLCSYSGINIPFEQLVFLHRLDRTGFPCRCSHRGKSFSESRSLQTQLMTHKPLSIPALSGSSCYLGKWLGKDVLIKVFKGKILQARLWEGTCRLIWSLRHPCLVLTLGFCHCFPDIHCIVTEYIHSGSLQKLLYRGSCICMQSLSPEPLEARSPLYNLADTARVRADTGSNGEVLTDHSHRQFGPNSGLSTDPGSRAGMNAGLEESLSDLADLVDASSGGQDTFAWPQIPEYNHSFGIHTHNAIKIAKGVAAGCLYLKQRGLFHLNLKPSNILVEEDLSVKLADFGHCLLEASFYPPGENGLDTTFSKSNPVDGEKSLESFVTEYEVLSDAPESPRRTNEGVLNYLPPEVLQSNSPLLEPAKLWLENKLERCQSIDSYSIGAVIWEMINGQPPFAGLGSLQIQAFVGYFGATLDLRPAKDPLQLSNVSLIQGLISKCCGLTRSLHSSHSRGLHEPSPSPLTTSLPSPPNHPQSSFSSSSSSSSSSYSGLIPANKRETGDSDLRRIPLTQIMKELKAIEVMVS